MLVFKLKIPVFTIGNVASQNTVIAENPAPAELVFAKEHGTLKSATTPPLCELPIFSSIRLEFIPKEYASHPEMSLIGTNNKT